MGMFDRYEPRPALRCPVCGAALSEWQGKDGPCALFVWRQGVAAPVGQEAGEVSLPPAERARFRLPDEFTLRSWDCACPFPVQARGRCAGGVWSTTELVTAANARQEPGERRGAWRARRRWLESGEEA